jgi:hypothetical protein
MSESLAFEDLEKAYDLVAQAIDAAGPDKEALFLTKLCLALAYRVHELATIEEAIAIASADLEV